MNQIAQGSIVLVKKEVGNEIVQRIVDKNPPKKWIFARVARVSPNFLLVFEDPTEDTLTTYTYEDVLPLAKDIEEKYFHKMRVEEVIFLHFNFYSIRRSIKLFYYLIAKKNRIIYYYYYYLLF